MARVSCAANTLQQCKGREITKEPWGKSLAGVPDLHTLAWIWHKDDTASKRPDLQPLSEHHLETEALCAFQAFRVSEKVSYAAAAPKDQTGHGSASRMADGYLGIGVSLRSWAGSAGEKFCYVPNQKNLQLICLPSFRMQEVYLRAASGIICSEFFMPKQQILTLYFNDTLSSLNNIHRYGKSEYDHGEKRRSAAPMPQFEALWSRSADLRRSLIGRVADQVGDGSREMDM